MQNIGAYSISSSLTIIVELLVGNSFLVIHHPTLFYRLGLYRYVFYSSHTG
jgi:hypothetical protein